MAEAPANVAASIRQRLLNISRREGRVHDVVLVRYALERALHRLSISQHRDRFVLKGGMLVALWIEDGNRETRDVDLLAFGDSSAEDLKKTFAEILSMKADDGLRYDVEHLEAVGIREGLKYGGTRLETNAFIEKTRIPVTIDIAFGDALPASDLTLSYPSLLGMEEPNLRAYSVESVIAEKFHAMVTLGIANGRMKDYYDLWAIPKSVKVDADALVEAIRATFVRREMEVPADRIAGLSDDFVEDRRKQGQWAAYARSIDLKEPTLAEVIAAIRLLVEPACSRIREAEAQA